MKKSFTLVAMLVITCITLNSQQPWQQFSDIGIKDISSNFKSTPPEYGIILWWGWDGPVTDTVIKRDLDRIKSMGFRGVMIEAGYGMTAKYLSPEWFKLVTIAVEQAKLRDMRVWIEDEGKYPSGFAGGEFSNERPDLKMQGLVVTDRIDPKPGESISQKLPSYTLSAIAFNNDDKSCKIIDVSSGELKWQVPEGNWRIFLAGYRFRSSVTRSVNNPTRGKDTTASLFDYLNPLGTRQFIEWTHEQYKKYIGNEFGKTFMGFMGDEPDFAYTPWTPKMAEEFKKRKGYDVRPYLASFFTPQLTEEAKRVKADYWDVWSDLFRDNFFKVQADWCKENNIEYIVHLNHEDQVPGLVRSSGDFFKNMRYVGVPGVDAIWSQIWMDHVADYPKLASSAAHLFGRPRAFTESFAAYTYRPTVPQAKWVLDYQLVRGINSVQIMFMSASTSQLRPEPAPAPSGTANPAGVNPSVASRRTSFFQSDTFPPVAGYINRATYLLSQGRPACKIGIYFPTSSMWYGDNESYTSTLAISQQLLEQQRDFDFIDDQSLSSIMSIEKGSIKNLSGTFYLAMIIPPVSIIPKAVITKLQQFASSGGKVIFLGKNPSLLVDKTFLDASEPEVPAWAIKDPSGSITPSVLESLPAPDVKLDKQYSAIKYLHRKWKDADLYFFFNESKEMHAFNVSLEGKGKADIWDAMTGQISSLQGAVNKKDIIEVTLKFDPWETKFIIINR
jgi:hypothetical protein